MSWIAAADLISVFRYGIEGSLSGPVNAVAPGAVRNRAFTAALRQVVEVARVRSEAASA
jgi:NAD dependent epimerase/dehydratase family enzyme